MGVGSKFDKNLLNTSCSTGDDSASVQANEAGANGLAFEAAAEYIPARIIALRKQHAEHLLQVVRKAELRESSRQNKFCHTTSRKNREYLRRRLELNQIIGKVETRKAARYNSHPTKLAWDTKKCTQYQVLYSHIAMFG